MTGISGLSSCTVGGNNCLCFDELTKAEEKLIENNQVEVKYKKGEIICKQGSFASHVLFLCDGLVKIYIEGASGTLFLKIISPGNLIGLTSLSADNKYFQYFAVAYKDSTVKQIDINIMRDIIKQNAGFASELINTFCENTLQIYGRFYCMMHKQSYGRLADILLCLSGRIFKQNEFEPGLSRKELAELAGMSTENVIRMLKKFKDDGLIEEDGKILKIVNFERLKKISDHG